jgi:hypothetical protein
MTKPVVTSERLISSLGYRNGRVHNGYGGGTCSWSVLRWNRGWSRLCDRIPRLNDGIPDPLKGLDSLSHRPATAIEVYDILTSEVKRRRATFLPFATKLHLQPAKIEHSMRGNSTVSRVDRGGKSVRNCTVSHDQPKKYQIQYVSSGDPGEAGQRGRWPAGRTRRPSGD